MKTAARAGSNAKEDKRASMQTVRARWVSPFATIPASIPIRTSSTAARATPNVTAVNRAMAGSVCNGRTFAEPIYRTINLPAIAMTNTQVKTIALPSVGPQSADAADLRTMKAGPIAVPIRDLRQNRQVLSLGPKAMAIP